MRSISKSLVALLACAQLSLYPHKGPVHEEVIPVAVRSTSADLELISHAVERALSKTEYNTARLDILGRKGLPVLKDEEHTWLTPIVAQELGAYAVEILGHHLHKDGEYTTIQITASNGINNYEFTTKYSDQQSWIAAPVRTFTFSRGEESCTYTFDSIPKGWALQGAPDQERDYLNAILNSVMDVAPQIHTTELEKKSHYRMELHSAK
jgi:hypothetical protein